MRTLFDISFLFKKKNSVKFKRNPIFSHLHFLLFIMKNIFFVIVHFIIYNNSFKFFNLETIMKNIVNLQVLFLQKYYQEIPILS